MSERKLNKSNDREVRLKSYLNVSGQLPLIKYVPRTLRLVWENSLFLSIVSFGLVLLQGILPLATVYLTKEVIDVLVLSIEKGGGWEIFTNSMFPIILMGAVIITDQLLNTLQNYIGIIISDRTKDHMFSLVHQKATSLDLAFFESNTFYDQFRRSVNAISQPLSLIQSIQSLIKSIIVFLSMISVLYSFEWWIPLVLIIGSLPYLFVSIKTSRVLTKWRIANTINQRRQNYYHKILTSQDHAMEVRLYDLSKYYESKFNTISRKLRKEKITIQKNKVLALLLSNVFGLAALGLIGIWILRKSLNGLYNFGDLGMFWQTLNQGKSVINKLFENTDQTYSNLLFLDDLFTFLDLESSLEEQEPNNVYLPSLKKGIRLKDVSFSYPGSLDLALNNFNLFIPANKVVAIVGQNGAGKSTLIKLLCKLYNPNRGSLLWDDIDYSVLSTKSLRKKISVLFQKSNRYNETVENNIVIGDLDRIPNDENIHDSLISSGSFEFVENLSEGIHTILGKWFGKTDLSGGQWQRLALARSFYRNSDFIILDEPTSSMDSWAENEWKKKFREHVSDRTALIITHKFTTAMTADIIHVMMDGKIVESGNHQELLENNGLYAESWLNQTEKNLNN